MVALVTKRFGIILHHYTWWAFLRNNIALRYGGVLPHCCACRHVGGLQPTHRTMLASQERTCWVPLCWLSTGELNNHKILSSLVWSWPNKNLSSPSFTKLKLVVLSKFVQVCHVVNSLWWLLWGCPVPFHMRAIINEISVHTLVDSQATH